MPWKQGWHLHFCHFPFSDSLHVTKEVGILSVNPFMPNIKCHFSVSCTFKQCGVLMRGKTGSGHLVSLDINGLYWPVNDQKWNAVFFKFHCCMDCIMNCIMN